MDEIAGPGHKPEIAHPIPKIAAPKINLMSRSTFDGNSNVFVYAHTASVFNLVERRPPALSRTVPCVPRLTSQQLTSRIARSIHQL